MIWGNNSKSDFGRYFITLPLNSRRAEVTGSREMLYVKLIKWLEGDKHTGPVCGKVILAWQDSGDLNINYQMPVWEQGWTQDIYNEIPHEGPRLSPSAVQAKPYCSLRQVLGEPHSSFAPNNECHSPDSDHSFLSGPLYSHTITCHITWIYFEILWLFIILVIFTLNVNL